MISNAASASPPGILWRAALETTHTGLIESPQLKPSAPYHLTNRQPGAGTASNVSSKDAAIALCIHTAPVEPATAGAHVPEPIDWTSPPSPTITFLLASNTALLAFVISILLS